MALATSRPNPPSSDIPATVRVAIILALPMVGAVGVAGIYLNKEVLVAAAWIALGLGGLVFVRPLVGVGIMTAMFMLAAYPTLLADLGFLTINNLIGLCLAVVLLAQITSARDLSMFKPLPIILLTFIGIMLVIATAHSKFAFPTMRVSQGTGQFGHALDKTADMMHDFWARLIFLLLFFAFVRDGRDTRAMFYVFALALFLAVPSALVNWWNGTLSHGFRTEASVTAGSNPNRLAMICLMEIACWWGWAITRGGGARVLTALSVIAGALLVILASGSRSGLLGTAVLGFLIQTGPRRYRLSVPQIALTLFAAAIALLTIVPPEAWQRALAFSTENAHAGSTMSIVAREQTIETAVQMVHDHYFLGIGLGNFREVSRQIYFDPFFRPPHNSYVWAISEGGIFVVGAYLFLFLRLWRDLNTAHRLMGRDPECVWVVIALRNVFYLYAFFAIFADLWLNPITYVLIGTIICMRRYLESLPPVATTRLVPALARAA